VVGRQKADIADTLHLRDVAMATSFWFSMGYKFSCMIASNTVFDCIGGFSGSSYSMKTADFPILRDVATATIFLAFYIWGAHLRHLVNTTEPSTCAGDAALCQITLTTCFKLGTSSVCSASQCVCLMTGFGPTTSTTSTLLLLLLLLLVVVLVVVRLL